MLISFVEKASTILPDSEIKSIMEKHLIKHAKKTNFADIIIDAVKKKAQA